MSARLSTPLSDLSLEDRFRGEKNEKENVTEKPTSPNVNTSKDVELLEICESTKENNNSVENGVSTLPQNKRNSSHNSSYHPTIDFSGTINYI